MSTSAIIMMLVSMLILWGGLAVAIWNISRRRGPTPDQPQREL